MYHSPRGSYLLRTETASCGPSGLSSVHSALFLVLVCCAMGKESQGITQICCYARSTIFSLKCAGYARRQKNDCARLCTLKNAQSCRKNCEHNIDTTIRLDSSGNINLPFPCFASLYPLDTPPPCKPLTFHRVGFSWTWSRQFRGT